MFTGDSLTKASNHVVETKIDNSFPNNQFALPMYKLYRQDFKHNEGGLMMYIRNDMPQFRRCDVERHPLITPMVELKLLLLTLQ